ncbi:hypothetical protein PILCRDRAFT_814057 [Piloderma croceum F 1598]|uniref:Uncharacterized protein n=1 Tax=Piloderma croceum (strain F 1598) TaxID=765440 RepID=A0A0C3FUT3_PILCF|nr:hypothetical protein PILCRDRAFT_814057 [Piloderma croceum F 1598]
MENNERRVKDVIMRISGTALGSIPGFVIFFLGRAVDAPFQYLLFSRGWGVKALSTIGLHGNSTLLKEGPGAWGLGPVPTLLTGLYAVAAMRHFYWITFTNTYKWPFTQAAAIVLSNLWFDTFNTLSTIHAISSSSPVVAGSFIEALGWKQWAGVGLFVAGMLIETLAEESRKRFKNNPSNKGKIDDTGLWSIVRHPNYAGFTLWRSGASLATGSLGYSIGMYIFIISLFVFQAIPGLSGHMSQHYGEQWISYKKRVPYRLFPGIV